MTNPSMEWPGSQKPIDTTEPIFIACINDPVHMEYYAKVEAAEAYYALHKSKSDPLRYDALPAVLAARSAFRMKVNRLYMQVGSTLPPVSVFTPEENAEIDAWLAVHYAQDNQLIRCIEETAQAESDFRSMLDHPEHWQFPDEWVDGRIPLHRGSLGIVRRHAICATLMGYLQREGVPGFEREWHGWAGSALRQVAKVHERVVATYSSVFDEGGKEIETEADTEIDHTFPLYVGPRPKPTKAAIRKDQRRRKAEREGDPSNSKAARKMRKWRAAKKVNSDILKRAAEIS